MPQNTSQYGPLAGLPLSQNIGQRDLLNEFPITASPTPMDPKSAFAWRASLYASAALGGITWGLMKRTVNPPAPLRIRVPAHVGSNFEGLVVRVDGQLWKLVRTFDDPSTWTEPGVRHRAANGIGGEVYRTDPVDDQWELCDLTDDPTESRNRWTDPELHELRQHLRMQLKQARASSVPERNQPWPYVSRRTPVTRPGLVRRALARLDGYTSAAVQS